MIFLYSLTVFDSALFIVETDNKWWILVGILGSMFLATLAAFLCCYFDCCGWLGGGLRRRKQDEEETQIVKYTEVKRVTSISHLYIFWGHLDPLTMCTINGISFFTFGYT